MTNSSSRIDALQGFSSAIADTTLLVGCAPDQIITDDLILNQVVDVMEQAGLEEIPYFEWEILSNGEDSALFSLFQSNLPREERLKTLAEFIEWGIDWYGHDIFRGISIHPVFTFWDDLYEIAPENIDSGLAMALIIVGALEIILPEGLEVADCDTDYYCFQPQAGHLVAAAMIQAADYLAVSDEEMVALAFKEPFIAFISYWFLTDLSESNPWINILERNETEIPWLVEWKQLPNLLLRYREANKITTLLPGETELLDPFWVAKQIARFYKFDAFVLGKNE